MVRFKEFVTEVTQDPISKRQQAASRGLNTFSDAERWSTDYVLNRVMQAVAATDGTFVPDISAKSWIGKSKSAHPYTREEQEMLKKAYQAAGAAYQDVNRGDMDSEELGSTNKVSPIQGFSGYR